ncbi:PaaX family transcriptional regulator [Streptomyces sp. NBC_01221]|uniref:PaaX family transcriptional regulator n=1 Tax=Streptomyces sp. NBC_01221 TaxID=2903782 RepID=UPI0022500842|nr:PaaX family transcriptional regulator C-terminal domain-containing protein [Streptomyces sp. NBC_01221]MCX4789904.1 PaaX family transcriptional regulator [Streptomyces sp. NBC_01221]
MNTVSGTEAESEPGSLGKVQPRQLIVTVYGLYARDTGGWMSVASLIQLLADLGVEAPTVRSSVSRLKRAGLLEAESVSGAAGYRISPETERILRDGDPRIFAARRATVDEGWVLVVFSVPESERAKRHTLRTQLTRLGFGSVSAGVWIAPGHVHGEAEDMLARHGLRSYADLFRADYLSVAGGGDGGLSAKVRSWWDTVRLQRLYVAFLAAHRPAAERIAGGSPLTDREAFTTYIRVLTDWRRLVYLDPGVPRELLPAEWSGTEASELFDELHTRLAGPAHRHVERLRTG